MNDNIMHENDIVMNSHQQLILTVSLLSVNNYINGKLKILSLHNSEENSKMLSLQIPSPLSPLTPQTKHPNKLIPRNVVVKGLQSEDTLPVELRQELLPKHVAVIMDGNTRWARMKGLPAPMGYEAGVRALKRLVELCCQWGISVVTVFAFSCENWTRPKMEVDFLMGLFQRKLNEELQNFVREDIRISIIGDTLKLPKSLIDLIAHAEETTKNNTRLHLVVAVNYSGQYDVTQACKRISQKVKDGQIEPEDINPLMVQEELETSCIDFPCPDLFIRTSGELRISNFLLWQLAYTELYFAQSHWPDFGEIEFLEALHSFQQRQRRFGGRDS